MELTIKICVNYGKIKEIPTGWKNKFSLAKLVISYLRWHFLALGLMIG